MTKKIIIAFLIPSLFIYLTGCYSMYDIPKEELKTFPNSKLRVITHNESYLFQKNSYSIEDDTLFGTIFYKKQPSIQKIIPVKDISTLQMEKFNSGNYFLFVIGIAVVSWGIVELVLGANPNH